MQDWHRWAMTLVLAFASGSIGAMSDPKASWQDILRHGSIAEIPAIAALKMTLEGKK
jgi:hypothetical protein